MPLFVVSDLHLGERTLACMFRDAEQGHRFADLCTAIGRNADSELVLLGDVFDLTAAHPPGKGLSAFGRALDVPVEDKPAPPLPEVMAQIRACNPVALDALEALSSEVKVTLVPGNHDRHLSDQGGREALDAAGLAKVGIEPMAVRRVLDKVVVLQHGHAWDPGNATPQGGGETMTGVIHHAVLPFLRHLAPRSNVQMDPDRIVALRPEGLPFPSLLAQQRFLQPRHLRGQRAVVTRHPPPGDVVEPVERGHHRPRRARLARAQRHLAVGQGGAGWDAAHDAGHRALEPRHLRATHEPSRMAPRPSRFEAST